MESFKPKRINSILCLKSNTKKKNQTNQLIIFDTDKDLICGNKYGKNNTYIYVGNIIR